VKSLQTPVGGAMHSETNLTPVGGANCSGTLAHSLVEGAGNSISLVEGAGSSRTLTVEVETGTCTLVGGKKGSEAKIGMAGGSETKEGGRDLYEFEGIKGSRESLGPPGFYLASRTSSTMGALLPGSWMLLGHEDGLGGK
jgi:hypothetical protein